MSYQLNNDQFQTSLTVPLFNIVQNLNFEVQKTASIFSHVSTCSISFTHVEKNLETREKLQQAYNKFFTEVADKIETIVFNIKNGEEPITINKTFSDQYLELTSDIVKDLLSGNKYLPFLNEGEPEKGSMGDRFVELVSKFAITKKDNNKKLSPSFLSIIEIQEWQINKVNTALADKVSDISFYVLD